MMSDGMKQLDFLPSEKQLSEEETASGDQKAPEVQVIYERKQPVILETSAWTEWQIESEGQAGEPPVRTFKETKQESRNLQERKVERGRMALEEQLSLFVSGLLAALGFSKREVTIHCSFWKFEELVANLLSPHDKEIDRVIFSGSSAEGVSGGLFYGGEKADFDVMKILENVKVVDEKDDCVSKEDATPDNIRQIIVREIPDKDYPGYTKLVVVRADPQSLQCMTEKNGQYFLSNTLIHQQSMQKHGSLRMMPNPNPAFRKQQYAESDLHGPAVNFKIDLPENITAMSHRMCGVSAEEVDELKHPRMDPYCEVDRVDCIKSLRWPFEATHFMTRPRPGVWPRKEIVECLVQNTPVYLAPVGHKSSPNVDLQWRFSFNVAEKMLVEDFNETQIQCYALLKIFLKDKLKLISPGILSSYCMKTTVFWLSEKMGRDNMIPSKLLHYFVQCLKLIQNWLGEHKMPHYFIKTRNVFQSNLDPVEVTNLMQALDEAMLEPISALANCKSFNVILRSSAGNPWILPLLSAYSYLFCPWLFPMLIAHSYMFAWLSMRTRILMTIYKNGANLWEPYYQRNLLQCMCKFKHTVEGTKNLAYGQPLLKILKSFLGFVCFANHCESLETTKDELSVNEIENLLLEGKDGDLALCPLKLATFYLRQDKFCQVLKITTSVLQRRQQLHNRHSFIDNLTLKLQEQVLLLFQLEDMKTLEKLVDIAIANLSSKAHQEEILYCREGCTEFWHFLNFPVEAAKNLAFDVTFMLQESSAIPRAVQLELVFLQPLRKKYCRVTISPLVYALYLRFLAFKATDDQIGCLSTLSKFKDLLSSEPTFYQAIGYNLLASCHAMMDRSHDAAQSLCCSLKITPTRNNVAFGYFAFVYSSLFR